MLRLALSLRAAQGLLRSALRSKKPAGFTIGLISQYRQILYTVYLL